MTAAVTITSTTTTIQDDVTTQDNSQQATTEAEAEGEADSVDEEVFEEESRWRLAVAKEKLNSLNKLNLLYTALIYFNNFAYVYM